MDLSTLVDNVTVAFQDASKLVQRIRDQRERMDGAALPAEPTKALLDSLTLGPVIIHGYYDNDLRRFGEPYSCGDLEARDQMKDVLINMQQSVISTLRIVYMDEQDLDFTALQNASDDCRANAGVCLGQLSQRMAGAARAEAMMLKGTGYPYTPATSVYGQRLAPPMGYSSSQSTHSSAGYGQLRNSDPIAEQMARLEIARDTGTPRPSQPNRQTSLNSFASQESMSQQSLSPPNLNGSFGSPPPVGVHRITDPDGESLRRPSSATLPFEDTPLLSPPMSPPSTTTSPPGIDQQPNRDSVASSGKTPSSPHVSRTSSFNHQPLMSGSQTGSESPGSKIPVYNSIHDLHKSFSNPEPFHTPNSFANRIQGYQAANAHVQYLQSNARPPAHMVQAHQERLRQMQQQYYLNQHSQTGYPPPVGPPPGSMLPPMPSMAQLNSHPPLNTPLIPRPYNVHPESSGPIPVIQPTHPTPPKQQVHSGPIQSIPRLFQRTSVGPAPSKNSPNTTPQLQSPISPQQQFQAQIPPLRPQPSQTLFQNSQTASPSIMPEPQAPIVAPLFPRVHPIPEIPQRSPHHTVPGQVIAPKPSGPANLPTEKALQGFCKCAFRLQIGLDKKAFIVANRPIGVMNMLQYWRCDKCSFEGPLSTIVITSGDGKFKRSKSDKIFDPKIRVSTTGGVRYRWTFLAKCHVEIKNLFPPEGIRDGSFGSFGCIFCCAEGAQRGWLKDSAFNPAGGVRMNSSAPNTPIFGNIESFMEHLELHRTQKGCPNTEIVNRMRAVVGRTAEANEDWDINFVPL